MSILIPEHNSKSLLPVSYLHLLGNIFSLIGYTLLPPPIHGDIKGSSEYYPKSIVRQPSSHHKGVRT